LASQLAGDFTILLVLWLVVRLDEPTVLFNDAASLAAFQI
jgi:hypothetical protein